MLNFRIGYDEARPRALPVAFAKRQGGSENFGVIASTQMTVPVGLTLPLKRRQSHGASYPDRCNDLRCSEDKP